MPNAVPTVSPLLDPNWAWDVSGWSNQTTITSNVESSVGPGSEGFGQNNAGVSGLLAQTMEAGTATATALAAATNVFYGSLVYVPEGATTTKATCLNDTITSQTHGYLILMSPVTATSATIVATTADGGSSAIATGAAVSWAASTTLAPGYYYLGVATTGGSSTFKGLAVAQVTGGNLNTVGLLGLSRYVTAAITLSATAPSGTVTIAKQTTLGTMYAAMY